MTHSLCSVALPFVAKQELVEKRVFLSIVELKSSSFFTAESRSECFINLTLDNEWHVLINIVV